MASVVAAVLASWLIGSIPAAFIVTKIRTGKDIRTTGSGNSGATNVFRALGARFAIPVLLFDFMKGFLPVLWILRGDYAFALPATFVALMAGTAAILGHMFPPYIGWRGGKGVATGAGVVTALYPPLFPACLAVFATTFLLTRKMSLSSIVAAVSVPLFYAALCAVTRTPMDWMLLAYFALIPSIVVARHWRNIGRILAGTEEKLF